ncbi:MAG: PEP-CTERM system TPR-repeat protein PrsT [Thiobacillus sp.]|nr:PEP-CTERM system TPR-repeat protein PrsT [Thiobacillus sp.]
MHKPPKPIAPLLALLLAIFLAGCGGKTPEEHFEQGKALLAKGDRQGAIVEFKNTLQAQPANAAARMLLGRIYLSSEAYADARKELEQAREKGAPDEEVLPLLAQALVRNGEPQAVVDLGNPSDKFGAPARAALYTWRAAALLGLEKEDQALEAITGAEAADGRLPDLLLLKAKVALSKQDKTRARQLLEAALAENAKFNEALYLKAALLQSEDKHDEALKVYQQIVANDSGQFRAHLALHGLHLRARDMGAAERDLQSAEKSGSKDLLVRLARATFELQRGQLDKASSVLQDLLRAAPNHVPTMLAYAMTSYAQGMYNQSQKYASGVLGAQPDNLIAARILAGSQLRQGDAPGALKTLEPLLAKYKDDLQLLTLAGDAHLQLGHNTKAQGYLDRAAQLSPDNASISGLQAVGLLAAGQRDDALAHLEHMASQGDKPGRADLAVVLMHMGDRAYDKALDAIAKMEGKAPRNPVAENLRAAALMGKGDRQGARQALERALALQPDFYPAAFNLARLDMLDNKPEVASKRFHAVLSKDKANVRAMLALADLAAIKRHESEFVDWLRKAIKADPRSLQAHAALVRYHLTRKDAAKALAQAREAAAANSDDLNTLKLLGDTLLATGNLDPAIDTYTGITQKAPKSPEALLDLARAQLADGRVLPARENLRQALAIRPNFHPAKETLIRAEMADKQVESALGLARELQSQQPKSPSGFAAEADILWSQQRFPQAIKAYEQAFAKDPSTGRFVNLHRALMAANRVAEADQKLAAWLKQHPDDHSARLYAAESHMRGKRYNEAIVEYEALLKAGQGNAAVYNNLATLYQRGNDPRALATAEQAYKLAPDHPGVMDTLGWILVRQGKSARGLDLLAKASAQAPHVPTLRYHHGAALVRAGKKAEARKELEAAIFIKQKFPEEEEARALLSSL